MKAVTLTRLYLAGAVAFAGVSAHQVVQQPLASDDLPSLWLKKPLVDTEALEATIQVDNLLARAQALFDAAKLSEDEYNRPTRVIGSAGTLHPPATLGLEIS